MQVIAGKARRLHLVTVPGLDTRPTTDRIKETLFNILQPELGGCSFLDLFAGSGAIGIEALSRGAGRAVFVENSRKAAACIRQNLTFTRLDDQAEIMEMDVMAALRRLEAKGEKFHIIFMDPPYRKDWEEKVFEFLRSSSVADEDTIIITEADKNTSFDYLEEMGFDMYREKIYKTNKHIFARKEI